MNRQAFEQLQIPPEIRAFAEKSVEEARRAFEGFASAASEAAGSLEGRAAAAQEGGKEVAQKAMRFAEQNIASSFDLMQKLVRAEDVNDVLKLHSDYVTRQVETLSGQAKELGEAGARMALGAARAKPGSKQTPA